MKDEIVVSVDIPWSDIDAEVCRVQKYLSPKEMDETIAAGGFGARCCLLVECSKFEKKLLIPVFHKIDFNNLKSLFKTRGIATGEEVLISWSKRYYKNFLYRKIYFFLPRFWIMVCKKNAYELMFDSNYRPDLKGEARSLEEKPLLVVKPSVLD